MIFVPSGELTNTLLSIPGLWQFCYNSMKIIWIFKSATVHLLTTAKQISTFANLLLGYLNDSALRPNLPMLRRCNNFSFFQYPFFLLVPFFQNLTRLPSILGRFEQKPTGWGLELGGSREIGDVSGLEVGSTEHLKEMVIAIQLLGIFKTFCRQQQFYPHAWQQAPKGTKHHQHPCTLWPRGE